MPPVRNVPLIERKAELAARNKELAEHSTECPACSSTRRPKPACGWAAERKEEIKEIREDIRTWFDPPPDSVTLF